jgi:capsular polysaccharide biosynthesis protein
MLEVVPRVMMLRRSGLEADWYVVECQSRYQQRVLELLGIPRHRWIQPHYSLHLKADLLVRPSQPGAVAWQDLATALTQAATEKLTSFAKKGQRRIYISRKAATHRRIANEAELESHLKGYGFQSYSFENIDFADQLSLVNQAEVIVAVHGAALANLIFAKPGTPVVEICPIHRYNPDCFPRVSRKVGLQHATVMATSSRFRQELQVNLADMDAALSHVGVQPQDGSSSQRSKAA